ncbi:ABC transporter substrate-binding protein [Rathayibacter sp. VKM Ac-2630]|uniref:ABC transporter substrate-binding protein n=1 Tax=Rathayibacter sp. VKM Ac-2630 TaxID=1938617 RepID=UPI001F2D0A69|nr:extracellular solute-binding protein [Rathayibacter sp. VKM Ac-2630]
MMFSTKRTRLAAAAIAAVAAISLTACSGGGASGSSTVDPDEEITLDYTFWGNDDRAARYDQAIALFEEEHPNITINSTFTDYPGYWEKRQTEAAGGGLPDVMQFDYTYLRQYGDNGLLGDLSEYFGGVVDESTISEDLLATGELDGATYAIPTGYSAWAIFQNQDLLTANGLEPYAGGGSWEDYAAYVADVTEKTGGAVYGGTDYTGRIQNFELQLRADGKELFTEDGELGFTEDDLAAFWEQGDEMRTTTGVPAARLQELLPKSGFGAGIASSEMSWSNFLGGYIGDSGASEIVMTAPPTADEGSKDLYQKVGLMQAISSATEHPEAAATFLDFLINSPEVGEIFGATLGIPASSAQLEGANLEGPDKQVSDYLESVSDRIGEAPAAPVAGYGAIEANFLDLGTSLGLGAVSVDEAVQQFFDETAVTLGN